MSADSSSVSDLVNFASSAVTVIGGLVQLMSEIAGDHRRIRYAELSVGSLGKWFRIPWMLALRVSHALLFLVTSLAVVSLMSGITWFDGGFGRAAKWLFTHGPELLLAYVVLALAVHLRLPGKLWFYAGCIRSRYSRRTAFDPGLINAEWLFLRGTADPALINIDRIRCEVVAGFLHRIPSEKTAGDRADTSGAASNWPLANRANALLFACAIEGVVAELPKGKDRKLSELFCAFNAADQETWSPAAISPTGTIEAIAGLLKATKTMSDLADEQAVHAVVCQTATLLSQDYKGNAVSLALGRVTWMSGNSIDHVQTNLREISALDGVQRPGRDIQFLKLALEARVWPDMKTEFLYPFSSSVAAFLLNTGCLVCTPGTERIVVDPLFMRLVAAAEEIIVESAAEILRRQPALGLNLRLPSNPSRWEIARGVDYTLWWLARRPVGWRLAIDSLDQEAGEGAMSQKWSVSAKTMVRRG